MKKLIRKLFIRFFIPQHKFKKTDIIKTQNGDILFEVIGLYYDQNLVPVMELQIYNTDKRGFVSGADITAYVQHKGATPGSPVYN